MPDPDIRVLADVVEQRCEPDECDTEETRRAREALRRLEQRLESAEAMHGMLSTRYALVWPIPGVIMSGKRRRKALAQYERLRSEAGGQDEGRSGGGGPRPNDGESEGRSDESEGRSGERGPSPSAAAEEPRGERKT